MGVTPRNGFPWPEDGDNADGPAAFEALALAIDSAVATMLIGTLAARPAPSKPYRLYLATDVDVLYVDTGTAWRAVVPAASAITTAMLGAGVVTEAKLGTGAVTATKIAADAVGSAAIAAQAVAASELDAAILRELSTRCVYGIGGGDVVVIGAGGWRQVGEIAGHGNGIRLPAISGLTIQTRITTRWRTASSNGGAVAIGVGTPDLAITADTGTIASFDGYPSADSGWQTANPTIDGFFQARNDSAGGSWSVWIQSVHVFQRYTK